VDENPTTAIKYMVQGIPTVIIFKDGKPIKTLVGVKPEVEYKAELDALLGNKPQESKTESSEE
jgi:thioredoxin 1